MKNLTNCSPTEFLKQTVRLRPVLKKWVEKTGIDEIRKRKPEGFDGMTKAEKEAAVQNQGTQNLSDMLEAAMVEDPEGTLEVLGLCCFVEPEDIDSHPMTEYLEAVFEMLKNEAVRSFFILALRSKTSSSSEA